MEPEKLLRVRLRVRVGERVRWISHLEYLRMMTRALRRSRLPIVYSEGFNPHVRIAFAHARAVGLSSDGEYADVLLSEGIPIDEVQSRLNAVLPSGFVILRSQYVNLSGPGLSSVLNAGRYRFEFLPDPPEERKWMEAVQGLLRQTALPVMRLRHRKPPRQLDLAPHVYGVELEDSESNARRFILADLATGSQFNIRPHEFLEIMSPYLPCTQKGETPSCQRIHRIDLFCFADGQRISAWDL